MCMYVRDRKKRGRERVRERKGVIEWGEGEGERP